MTTPTTQDVLNAAAKLRRPLTTAQAEPLAVYLVQLTTWNRKMNLVGKSGWREVFTTLIVDSLHLADFLADLQTEKRLEAPVTMDLGAGAGLPGIPLRCLWQAGEYWLVEAREKRTLFMRSAVGRMGLAHTHVLRCRAEDSLAHLKAQGIQTQADLVLSRAFMPWRELLPFVRPLLRDDGALVVLANDPPPETAALPPGWTVERSMDYPAAGAIRFFWELTPTS